MAKASEARGLSILLLLLLATAAVGQQYKPAIEYQSLMNMRYYENNGGFLIEDLQLVFPPTNIGNAKLVVADLSGGVVDSVPLRFERMGFPAFGRFLPASGNPGNVRVGKSGSFIMSVVLDGQTITALPFSLREQNSSDPFNPGKKFVRDGPFPDLAYFSVVPDDPNGEVRFNWWMSLREIPGAPKDAKVTVHLLINGQEFADSRGPVIPSLTDWEFFQHRQLSVPTMPRNHWLTLADLTKANSEITLVVKANGQVIKSYKTRVTNGQIQRLPQNALTAEPHAGFISPRFIDTTRTSPVRDGMFDMYWVRKN